MTYYKTDEYTIKKICEFEGFESKAYKCPAGVWTIGYGHTSNVNPGQIITKEQAEKYLQEDISPIEKYLNSTNICRTQGQFNALVDFIYNLGIGVFKKSTLLKYIKQYQSDEAICNQIMRWIYGNGKKLPGLIKRRKWETKMWYAK